MCTSYFSLTCFYTFLINAVFDLDVENYKDATKISATEIHECGYLK